MTDKNAVVEQKQFVSLDDQVQKLRDQFLISGPPQHICKEVVEAVIDLYDAMDEHHECYLDDFYDAIGHGGKLTKDERLLLGVALGRAFCSYKIKTQNKSN